MNDGTHYLCWEAPDGARQHLNRTFSDVCVAALVAKANGGADRYRALPAALLAPWLTRQAFIGWTTPDGNRCRMGQPMSQDMAEILTQRFNEQFERNTHVVVPVEDAESWTIV